ncbi:universal stress protein [Streptomyces sp. NPDC014872]|uniref:universal stress protein n=1 Tax=Streptomyces sp. NPDC014872 TaxID=3364926 RepID=UPI0036F55DEB
MNSSPYGPGAARPPTESPVDTYRRRAERHLDDMLAVLDATGSGPVVSRQVVQGPAHQVLIEAAAGAELLVVGVHRSDGRPRPHLGPVNHAVLHYASCPVAVVPDIR